MPSVPQHFRLARRLIKNNFKITDLSSCQYETRNHWQATDLKKPFLSSAQFIRYFGLMDWEAQEPLDGNRTDVASRTSAAHSRIEPMPLRASAAHLRIELMPLRASATYSRIEPMPSRDSAAHLRIKPCTNTDIHGLHPGRFRDMLSGR